MFPTATIATTSLFLVTFLASASASAIKGHAKVHEEPAARSVKFPAPVSSQLDKAAKSASVLPVGQMLAAPIVQPAAPVLESSRKVYNDESIRRSVGQQAVEQPVPVAAFKSVEQPAKSPIVVPQQQQAPAEQVAAPVAPVVPVVAPVIEPKSSPAVEPKSLPVVADPAKEAAKPVVKDELPPQSDRAAPIKDEKVPIVAQSSPMVHVEQVVPAKIPEPVQAPVVAQLVQPLVQAEPVGPVVPVVQAQLEPVKVVEQSSLEAKREEPAPSQAEPIEVPAPDPGLVLSEPIDSTTKLLIDLDEHVQKFLPAEDKQEPQPAKEPVLVSGVDYSPAAAHSPNEPSGKSNAPLVPYSSSGSSDAEPIVPPLPSLEGVEKASAGQAAPVAPVSQPASASPGSSGQSPSASRQANHHNQNQQQVITQLLDQLDSLQNRIQDTINQLVARRRYVMSALLRPMGTYVRRVRTNLERLQNRVNQLQAAAVSVGGGSGGQNRPGGFVDAAAIETIRRRIDDISKRISDIVNRIRFSLTPTSAPLNSNGRK